MPHSFIRNFLASRLHPFLAVWMFLHNSCHVCTVQIYNMIFLYKFLEQWKFSKMNWKYKSLSHLITGIESVLNGVWFEITTVIACDQNLPGNIQLQGCEHCRPIIFSLTLLYHRHAVRRNVCCLATCAINQAQSVIIISWKYQVYLSIQNKELQNVNRQISIVNPFWLHNII